jgi:RNA polymerase sigma-70 factor (ECF subfamily)
VNPPHAPTPSATRPLDPRTTAVVDEHALFRKALADVRRSLRRLHVPAADRDDLAQKILIAVYAKRHEYQPARGLFKTWIRGFVVNFMHVYRRTRIKAGQLAELPLDLADTKAGVEEQTMAEQFRGLLHEELLPQVDVDLRTVVIAHDLDDLKFETIAVQQGIPLSTAHDRYQRGIAQLQAAYKRHQLRQRAQGLAVLPLPLAQLLAADRAVPDISDEMVERAWSGVQRAIRWRNRWIALRTLLGHPGLHLAVTFVGGVGLGLALRRTPPPVPVVFVQPLLAAPAPIVAITSASASPPRPPSPPSPPSMAVAALPVPPASSAPTPASSALHRQPSKEQLAFRVAQQSFNRGRFDVARAALNALERDYPTGELVIERQHLREQLAQVSEEGEH